jgi:hypothetical protein
MKKSAALFAGTVVAISAYYYDFHTSQSIACLDAVYGGCIKANIKYYGLLAGLLTTLAIARFVLKIKIKNFYIITVILFASLFIAFILLNNLLGRS